MHQPATRASFVLGWGCAAVGACAAAYFGWLWVSSEAPPLQAASGGSVFRLSPVEFTREALGSEPVFHPWITNVQIIDLDPDGLPDVLSCDARRNRVVWLRQGAPGEWEEHSLGDDIIAPAHATPVDLDSDGDRDIVVAELGSIWPDDGVIGKVVLLENEGGRYTRRVLLDDVRRVADVQAADLTGDGRPDLVVAVFGYARGQILWLENLGNLQFRDSELLSAPGTIHVPLADYDADGDLDIAAIVSQDEEELWAFENLGGGEFRARQLWFSLNFDLGSAGLVRADLNRDGRPDLILPVGDNLEDLHSYPQPYHGCLWFENKGDWQFEMKRIGQFGGTYAADVGDLNADGHLDVVLVSMFNDWDRPENASVIWLETDGRENFVPWQIDTQPTHLVTVSCGDLNADGRCDVVSGGLHLTGPFDRVGGVTAWLNRGSAP